MEARTTVQIAKYVAALALAMEQTQPGSQPMGTGRGRQSCEQETFIEATRQAVNVFEDALLKCDNACRDFETACENDHRLMAAAFGIVLRLQTQVQD
jgi:hypothetical protein